MTDKKKAIVTGAAGFAGYSLTTHLLMHGYEVYAVVRPKSAHNNRLYSDNVVKSLKMDLNRGFFECCTEKENISSEYVSKYLHVIEVDSSEYASLFKKIPDKSDVFFHLTWGGGRDSFEEQIENIDHTIAALEAAAKMGCSRFVCIGSQAEYGIVEGTITENILPKPVNAYGAAKVAALYLTKRSAEILGIEWVWGRIFSLYGLYEPAGRMLPDLIRKLKKGEKVSLSDCTQNWDYLDAGDAAEAIIALAERGRAGEIYNIADGNYKQLKDFVAVMAEKYGDISSVTFGERANPYVSLSPSVNKINMDTGWTSKITFLEGYDAILDVEGI